MRLRSLALVLAGSLVVMEFCCRWHDSCVRRRYTCADWRGITTFCQEVGKSARMRDRLLGARRLEQFALAVIADGRRIPLCDVKDWLPEPSIVGDGVLVYFLAEAGECHELPFVTHGQVRLVVRHTIGDDPYVLAVYVDQNDIPGEASGRGH